MDTAPGAPKAGQQLQQQEEKKLCCGIALSTWVKIVQMVIGALMIISAVFNILDIELNIMLFVFKFYEV